mgnify:CR=1 FL=1
MKLSRTCLRELSKKYRTVLIKCLMLNAIMFSTSAGAEVKINNDDFISEKTITVKTESLGNKIDSITLTNGSNNTIKGSWKGWTDNPNGGSHSNGEYFDIDKVTLADNTTLTLNRVGLKFIKEGTGENGETIIAEVLNFNGIPTNKIDIKNSTLILKETRFDASSDDESVDGFFAEFENATFKIIDSELPVSGPFTLNNSNLYYTCLNCDVEVDEIPTSGHSNFDCSMEGNNLTINNSTIQLGDITRIKTPTDIETPKDKDQAKLEAKGNLIINKSTINMEGDSLLSYNGIVHENAETEHHVSVIDSVINLKNNAKVAIGTEDEEATASAKLNFLNSKIHLTDNTSIVFDSQNREQTTITNSQIEMTGSSSMFLNDVVLETTKDSTVKTTLVMKGNSTVTANNVEIRDAVIDMTGNSFLDVWDVTMEGVETTGNASIRIRKNESIETQSGEDIVALRLNNMNIKTNIISDNVNNKVQFLGDVKFSGLFDPATAEIGNGSTSALLSRDGYDDEITYNLNKNGTLKYEKDAYLYDSTIHTHGVGETRGDNNAFADGKYALNSLHFNGGSLDIRNGKASKIKLSDLTVSQESNLYLDADLANKVMDTLTADTINVTAKLNIAGLNLISDAIEDETVVNFTTDDTLLSNVDYTGEKSGLKALSPLYVYDVEYDNTSGDFTFKRQSSGVYNPSVYSASSIAQTVGFLQQNISSIVFDKISVPTPAFAGRSGGDEPKLQNVWASVIGFDDNVEFDSFNTVDSEMFSVVTGVNSIEKETSLGNAVLGAYVGYLNGEQTYTGNEINQEGGYVGLSGAIRKENVSLLSVLNTGFIRNEAEHSFGTDKYNTYWVGVSAKIGYDYDLSEDITIQPFVYGGYTLVKSEDYTSKSGLRIKSDNLHLYEVAPGIKVDKSFNNGWSGYVQAKYAFVMDNGGDTTADAVALPNISVKDYAEYGLGIEKELSSDWNVSASINRRDGGRQGWNGSLMFKYNF